MKIRLTEQDLCYLVENCVNKILNESPSLLSQEKVIAQFIQSHPHDNYDYSRVNYINDGIKVIIGCKKHKKEYWFEQTPHNHKRGE